jgi:hypothetical protein
VRIRRHRIKDFEHLYFTFTIDVFIVSAVLPFCNSVEELLTNRKKLFTFQYTVHVVLRL